MTVHRILRGVAGLLILLSLLLSYNNKWWLLLAAFVGFNLAQSAFTDNCPLLWVLRRMGVPESARGPAETKTKI